MKTIGLIGGMSPESTVFYYKTLNRLTKDRLGGHASAKIILHSVNFAETHALQAAGEWEILGAQLADAAKGLERAGADMIALATNTMHKCAPAIEAATDLPFIHIADATAEALIRDNHQRPLLLGTRFTMAERFYTDRLIARGLSPVLPPPDAQAEIDQIIFDDLVHGTVTQTSRQCYIDIVEAARSEEADSVILGCTEIGMLLNETNSPLPPYDTALLHCHILIRQSVS